MQRIRTVFFSLTILLFSFSVAAQNDADSLKALIKAANEDSLKVDLLNNLCKALWTSEHQEDVIAFGTQAKELSEKLNYRKGLAYAYKNIGRGYFNQSKYLEALQYYESSLAVFDSVGDKTGVANMQSNIGNIYFNKGAETKALDYFFKSLKTSEELGDTLRMVTTLNNIGTVYQNKPQTIDQALIYFLKTTPLIPGIHDNDLKNNSIGIISCNIGEIYLLKIEEIIKINHTESQVKIFSDSALSFFNQSLKAYEGVGDAAYTYNDIGRLYRAEKNYDMAITNHKKAYEIATKYDSKNDVAISLLGLGQTYLQKKDFKSALTAFKEAESLAGETESKYSQKDIYDGLSKVYGELNDFRNAFKYQNLLIASKDDIYNIEQDKKLGKIAFEYDIDKKKGEINLLTKDQELKQKEIARQKLVRNGFIGGFAVVLLFAGVFLSQRNRISKEKKRSDELLLNILPEETAEELKATGTAKAKSFDIVSVLFTDFKNFTQASEILSPAELVAEINHCYSEFDKIITRHGIEKIKTIGDAYMCAGGLPTANTTNPFDVVSAGIEMVTFIEKNKQERIAKGQPYFELRCGVHTGPVVAGIVGIKKFAYDIWGDTVNTASRMESSGEIGKVNISGATYELVKGKFKCEHRGKVKAKNKGEIDMYFVESLI